MTGNVQLGEFEFNPVEEQDFRLAVEGASKTGKSNSLAVILEDLAEANIPTLVIERLGILSSVRKEDERMVVVGARPEKGVDLAIPMEQLDEVVELMFDRSLKVILDISTYEDEGEGHTEHKAAAKVLKALNQKARENLRTGNRLKCLTLIDEVHMLAPETNAPIEVDDHVKKCRSQIIKISTEGGNKGINLITAYQRRAYTSKGVVSQSDNYVIHRLHATDRKEVAREIGVDQEEIEELGVGEILAYGDLTKQRVLGPTKVRKRESPDPREAQFELPEPSEEISDALSQIQETVEQNQKKEEERRDKIEQLEKKLEEREETIQELEKEIRSGQRLEGYLEKIAKGDTSEFDEELKEEVENLERVKEEKNKLEEKLEEKDSNIEELRLKLEEKEEEIDQLEAELSDKKEIEVVKEEIESNARSILRQIGAEDPDVEEAREQIQELRDQLKEKEQEKERLKKQKSEDVELKELEDYEDFIKSEAVQDAIKEAKKESSTSKRYIKGVIATILDKSGPVSYREVADRLGVSATTDVSSAASSLEARKVVEKQKVDGKTKVDLNIDGINQIRKAKRQREKTEELMEEL